MNTPSHLIAKIMLIGFLSFSINNAYSITKNKILKTKKDTSSDMSILGQIVVKNKAVKGGYKVEVLYYDSITATVNVKNNESVKFLLKKDSPYVIRISKKGFIPRYICLNTSTHETLNKTGLYTFYFETDFIETAEAMRLDNEALELPIGMITFDKKTGNFDNNKDYTSFVMQKIYSGLNETSQLNAQN